MIKIIPFEDLGQAEHGWLSARFHFSFAEYYDPDRLAFGPLRVWNDDLIRPGGGFPMHPHRDMEIVTYVRQGAISHEDNLGHKGVTQAGDIQVMSAGRGIRHSEYNHGTEDLRLFQIWLLPDRQGLEPRWEATTFPRGERKGRLIPVASGQGLPDTLTIHQDATLYAADLAAGDRVVHDLAPGRRVYLVPARGQVIVNDVAVSERAGAAISDVDRLDLVAGTDAELLLFDLP
ncbi:pirin family protein [Magnetospira thiophila]